VLHVVDLRDQHSELAHGASLYDLSVARRSCLIGRGAVDGGNELDVSAATGKRAQHIPFIAIVIWRCYPVLIRATRTDGFVGLIAALQETRQPGDCSPLSGQGTSAF